MGMSKEEFMSRYIEDMARKQKQKEMVVNGYCGERKAKIFKKQLRNKRCKKLCM